MATFNRADKTHWEEVRIRFLLDLELRDHDGASKGPNKYYIYHFLLDVNSI